ncbi:MAG: hypothetical protein WB947_04300 [Thermoplasmata archaeon]
MDAEATSDGPARRRTSWNLKAIVEDVAGRPIGELQDPNKPAHPYVDGKGAPPDRDERPPWASPPRRPPPEPVIYDPVEHVYPPLVGLVGREYHGSEHEHHQETLDKHRPDREASPGNPPRPAGPSHRPERIYLHYLLLHMDKLSPSALQYLRLAVDEEVAHRARPSLPPAAGP